MISPVIDAGYRNEQLHNWITVDYSGTGRVKVIVGQRSCYDEENINCNLTNVMNTTYRTHGDIWVESGETVKITGRYSQERYSWVILEVEGDVTISSVNNTFWIGYGTLYGHRAMQHSFAGSFLPYRILYPNNYDPSKSYPLFVVTTGSGREGSDNRKQAATQSQFGAYLFRDYYYDEDVEVFSIIPQHPYTSSTGTYKAHFTAPYFPFGSEGSPPPYPDCCNAPNYKGFFATALDSLIREMIDNPNMNIDENRIYFTGYSYGGKSSYEVAKQSPDIWAAVWPVAGWEVGSPYAVYRDEDNPLIPVTLNEREKCIPFKTNGTKEPKYDIGEMMQPYLEEEVAIYKNIPFRVVSGECDWMVFGAELVCDEINRQGGNCIHDIYPNVGHNGCYTRSYGDKDTILWMLSQTKN